MRSSLAPDTPPSPWAGNRPDADDGLPVAPVPRIALNQREACEALGMTDDTLRALEAEGLPVIRRGRRAIYPVAALERWLADRAAADRDAQEKGGHRD